MHPIKRRFFGFLMLLVPFSVFGLEYSDQIDWSTTQQVMLEGKVIPVLKSDKGINDENREYLPVYTKTFETTFRSAAEVSLDNLEFELIPEDETIDWTFVNEEISVQSSSGISKKQAKTTISFIPIRKRPDGRFERLVSFDAEVEFTAVQQDGEATRSYKDNSVLRKGEWFQVAVPQRGVYKMDYNFVVNTLGASGAAGVALGNLGVFGNGNGMLPENSSDARVDDLEELNILVSDLDNSGTFTSGDYILFYGQDPSAWTLDAGTNTFQHRMNLYTDREVYFFTTTEGNNKRVSFQPSAGSSTQSTNQFLDYQVYEPELYSLTESGRFWAGDQMNSISPDETVTFSFPNIISSRPVHIRSRAIGRSTVTGPRIRVEVNGASEMLHSVLSVGINYYDTFARASVEDKSVTVSGSNVSVRYYIQADRLAIDPEMQAWIDYTEVNAWRSIQHIGQALFFSNPEMTQAGSTTRFNIKNASGKIAWDVTDPFEVKQQEFLPDGGDHYFNQSTDVLKSYAVFDVNADVLTPEVIGAVSNQNLHAVGQPDMVIVTHEDFLTAAQDLASFHQTTSGLEVLIVEAKQIGQEFGGGTNDVTAIRDFMKMLYDRASGAEELPRYLLLFGDGSYDPKDRVDNNNNFVPTFQSSASLDPATTFTSDDFFGCLDDGEGANLLDNNDFMDVAVGRIPVKTAQEAQGVVDKIRAYASSSSFGDWRNSVAFIADDEDNNVHIRDADLIAEEARLEYQDYNFDKIYLDAFRQLSTPAGDRYPDVNAAIDSRLFKGALILNYTGHGGVNNWAHERIFGIDDILQLENLNNQPLFVTATCEFSRFDDPSKVSAGELLSISGNGGSIGLITTVRLVYSNANFSLNSAIFDYILEPVNANGDMPTIGEALLETKNFLIPLSTVDNINTRKFLLLGDPALKLAYPEYQVVTTAVNGVPISPDIDTLKALSKVTISGEVQDLQGNKLEGFNGVVSPSIYDKVQQVTTLKNDIKSNLKTFNLQKNIIYRGNATVTNGEFEYSFIVPKDIDYSIGSAKLSYYVQDQIAKDGNGATIDTVYVGGASDDFVPDDQGPKVEVYMNDEQFVFGGTTDENPILLVKLEDESGINTVGNGIGHDITAELDGESNNKIILNDFYEGALDDYTRGEVRYPLSDLSEGRHTLKVVAWDVHNNYGEGYTEFVVANSAEVALNHVLNYPNPFTTQTTFMFEHNRPGEALDVNIQIFTISGTIVKSIYRQVVSDGFRVSDITWDGFDEYGDPIGRGVYVYKVNVRGEDGSSAHHFEKLVILK